MYITKLIFRENLTHQQPLKTQTPFDITEKWHMKSKGIVIKETCCLILKLEK